MTNHDYPDPSRTIRQYLLQAMQTGEYAHSDRLPRESVLAEKLGISRTQLRDLLASLEREGFITRRHGVGTLINRYVFNVPTRMDIEVEFSDMIRQSGRQPRVDYVHVEEDAASEKIAAQLHLNPGDPIVRVSRLVSADGVPAIYCEDVVNQRLVRQGATQQDYKLPIFHFLEEFCHVIPYLDLTDVRPAAADGHLAAIFQVAEGTPLLNMDEVDYDIDGNPVFCSNQYYVDGIIRHTVMRKKL